MKGTWEGNSKEKDMKGAHYREHKGHFRKERR